MNENTEKAQKQNENKFRKHRLEDPITSIISSYTFTLRNIIFIIIILTISLFVILPWSIFLFCKFFSILDRNFLMDNSQILIPIEFNYEDLDSPTYSITDLDNIDYLNLNVDYDLYFNIDPFCSSESTKYDKYAIKFSLIDRQLLRYHVQKIKKSPSLKSKEQYTNNIFPITSNVINQHQYYNQTLESFVIDCMSSSEKNLIKTIIEPVLNLIELLFSSKVYKPNNIDKFQIFSNFKLNEKQYNQWKQSSILIELNNKNILIDNSNSHIFISKSIYQTLDNDYSASDFSSDTSRSISYYLKSVFNKNTFANFLKRYKILIHIIGCTSFFVTNLITYFVLTFTAYYYSNLYIYDQMYQQ